jgi:hypothetical protein
MKEWKKKWAHPPAPWNSVHCLPWYASSGIYCFIALLQQMAAPVQDPFELEEDNRTL